MPAHADKSGKHTSKAATHDTAQKKSDAKISQGGVQKMANNSPQAKKATTLQRMADQYVAQQQHPVPEKGSAPAQLKTSFAGSKVIQRVLNDEDKPIFRQWVQDQAAARNINAKFIPDLLKRANEVAESAVVNTLQQAKDRMEQAGGFPKFIAKSALVTLADAANRSEGITKDDVEAVLMYLGNARTAEFLGHGQTVHLRMLPGGDLDKNCHHYAFGGLKGADANFNFGTLSGLLHLDTAHNGDTIDASVIDGVANGGPFTVRNYGVAHSSREEGGKVWHKFVGVPCLFAIDEFPDLGNAVEKTFQVRSSPATVTGIGSFNLGPPEDQ